MVVIPSQISSQLRFPHDLGLFRSRNCGKVPQILLFSPSYCGCHQGSLGIPSFGDWGNNEGTSDYMIFSSDGEDSDGEILVTPMNDVDMPTIKKQFVTSEDALMATASRLALLGRMHKKDRVMYGFVCNLGLIIFLTLCLGFVDWCAWRIVRKPLDAFYFLSPFLASASLVACAGYVFVPILKRFNIRKKFRRKWPYMHYSKKGTPTIGGLFFIPIGLAVARVMGGSSTEISCTLLVTLAYAVIGLLDDILGLIKPDSFGLSQRIRLLLEVAVAAWFSFWLYTHNISSPYGMKMLIPLPACAGLVNLGPYYLLLIVFTFILMTNGHKLTDGPDGFAGGTSALAFAAMSVAVLPICSDVSVFGTSMAGACVGFLLHNRYKASVTMGNTGSLALGGALAAMASCSGMFIPLFIASGILVVEAIAVVIQILFFRITDSLQEKGRKSHNFFQVAPLHHYLEMWGMQKSSVVTCAYCIASFLAVLAGYVGLNSA
ncbi:phospho-N-acetylmuramoyl-pentapeptide-transferase homolog isoform X3 [Beta vulgaris subsp. vulgaris]|uniref:phospho-N-acetylmuramoyl-pentapeptide- transferase homolog isoform X3 n=1 Tax=Beta vulgaris subsp. vulgaris TaxID=3555 RepID=UPI00053F7F1E|nr:phospho-N-acetylmuramoyl-pentapeptide-transferase homolog isoform X3 [Beta vulgaris subsp. vulgaris]